MKTGVVSEAPGAAAPVEDWPGDPGREAIESQGLWRQLGLTDDEYRCFAQLLGRTPTWTELGMASVMWSEHCAYKHSRLALQRLPASGGRLVVGPGENAGVLDIGGGWGVAVRLESHNHPSFVEPYQGAATGVGGIVRDVLAVGARPVALLDALRFGRLEAPPRSRYLLEGVVAGIAGYGNAIGVPTVGGEVAFDPCYETNPLVNVMCVGLVRLDRLARARAEGPGNPVYLVGSLTGRDGIHGAGLLASRAFSGEEGAGQRPRVQVGDPFTEKLLIEACLEALEAGAVVGLQDLGAAGITAAASELAARAGTGMELDLDRVARREPDMTPFEVMLSESQERMMLVVRPERAPEVEATFRRWGLAFSRIGTVTGEGRLRVRIEGKLVADLPARLLAGGAPAYPVPGPRLPGPGAGAGASGPAAGAGLDLEALRERLRHLLGSPQGSSRAWIYTQYDHMVGIRTVLPPGHDGAVLRVPENGALVAVSLDGSHPWLARLSPYLAAAEAVLEGARNVAAAGAEPIGITNGLNFASPQRPDVMQQLADCVAGLADACRALGTPVTGGNVSFYNETGERAIVPTVMVGTVGRVAAPRPVPSGFQRAGDGVVLIGEPYLALPEAGDGWPMDLPFERRAIAFVVELARQGLLNACHDASDTGLAAALCEAAFLAPPGADGFRVELPALERAGGHPARLLFGAGGPCWVASTARASLAAVVQAGEAAGVPVRPVGTVVPGRLHLAVAGLGPVLDEPTEELRVRWERGLTG